MEFFSGENEKPSNESSSEVVIFSASGVVYTINSIEIRDIKKSKSYCK
jgi:hypothetical protein